jgi:hypothetical protein
MAQGYKDYTSLPVATGKGISIVTRYNDEVTAVLNETRTISFGRIDLESFTVEIYTKSTSAIVYLYIYDETTEIASFKFTQALQQVKFYNSKRYFDVLQYGIEPIPVLARLRETLRVYTELNIKYYISSGDGIKITCMTGIDGFNIDEE